MKLCTNFLYKGQILQYKSFTETHQFHMTIVYQSNFKSGLDHCLKYQVINVFVLEGIGFHCASFFNQNGPQSNVPHLANGLNYYSDLKLQVYLVIFYNDNVMSYHFSLRSLVNG